MLAFRSRRPASMPDLNLLRTLDVLLCEGNVARAAERLRLSPSAMSRSLARLRETTGDPLLVRAGRGLVPTPRAIELRDRIGPLVSEAIEMLRPARALDPRTLVRTFTIRSSEGFVDNFGPALLARIASVAPKVRLRFLAKPFKDSVPLRDGSVDLETGVVDDAMGPEIRTQGLFRDRLVGVVRADHSLVRGAVTAQRFAVQRHVLFARGSSERGPIDDALAAQGLKREIVAIVSSFSAAIALCRETNLVASVSERHTGNLRLGMYTFDLPIVVAPYTVCMMWHPRMDADPAHRWLRGCVREVTCDPV